MRVFDKEAICCADCHLCRIIDDDNGGTHIVCGYNGDNVYASYCNDDINKDCPFSKPLTQFDIESCGFELVDMARNPGYSDMLFGRDLVFNKTVLSKTKIQLIKFRKNNILHISIKDGATMFMGCVNNLPEFKLVLKMLNIE